MTFPLYLRVLLAGAVVAAVYTAWDDRSTAAGDGAKTQTSRTATGRRAFAQHSAALPPAAARSETAPVDLFPLQGRVLPPAQAHQQDQHAGEPASLAPPEPPPLPFQVVGVWREDGERHLVLSKEGATYIVCGRCRYGERSELYGPGDTIAGAYRINQIEGQQIIFEFLPMNAKQTLPLTDFAAETGN